MIFKCAAAKQVGTSHQETGRPCQDSVYIEKGEQFACVALADGAGSREDSELAANAATKAFAVELAARFDEWYAMSDEELKERTINFCREAVRVAAPETEPACTLLAVAAAQDGRSLACHIGDGAIIACSGDGDRILLSHPENGSELYYTFFLSGTKALEHFRIYRDIDPRYTAFLLCSDGAGASLFNLEGETARAVNIFAAWLAHYPEDEVSEKLSQELDDLFREKTNDDMSIALLGRFDSDICEDQNPIS